MDYQQNGGGYYKRPLWQWILIYAVIGGIAYAAVYYFFFSGSGWYSYGQSGANAPVTAPAQGGQWQDQPSAAPQNAREPSAPAPTAVPAQTSTTAPAPKSFAVNGNDTSADLTAITVAKDTPVSITFGADAQGTYHGGLDFRSSVVSTGPIAPGATKTVHFTADQSFAFTPYWPSTNIAKPYTIRIVVQ